MFRETLTAIFTPDRRSIFAFRFVLGLGLLFDLSNRLANATYFYARDGILPQDLWERYYGYRAYYWTLHFFWGQEWLFPVVLVLQIALAVCLMVGYRVRIVSALGWVLMLSLVLRNPLLFYGGDKLSPLLLLLSAFLPATSHPKWTLARTRTPLLVHLSFAALMVQVIILYAASGHSKLASSYWQRGDALTNVLDMNLLVRPLGQWFDQFDPLLVPMSISVPWAEIILPLVFLLPLWRGRARALAILGLLGLNVGIAFMLDVGYFMYYATAGLLGLLPTVFWEDLARGWAYVKWRFGWTWQFPHWVGSRFNLADTSESASETGGPTVLMRLRAGAASVALVVLMGITLVTGLESMKFFKLDYPTWTWNAIRGINAYQNWGLFTNPGTTATWYVSKAYLADGRWVDLLQEGEGVKWDYQYGPNALYRRNSKWRLAMAKINSFDNNDPLLRAFARALSARWENFQGEERAVEELTIYKLSQRLPIDSGTDPKWSEWVVWSR